MTGARADDERVVLLEAGTTGAPLICFHPTGGHLNEYRLLASLLAPLRVHGVRSRARVDARAEHGSLEAMAADYATLVSSLHGGPYRLLGWSMGGLIAHAVARLLEERGHEVALVGMIDPLLGGGDPDVDALPLGVTMAVQIFNPAPLPSPMLRRTVAQLGEIGGDLDRLVPWCIEKGLLPASGVDPGEFLATVQLLPRHRRLVLEHRPSPCNAEIALWRADARFRRDTFDWAAQTRSRLTERDVGGTHFTIVHSPYVERIAGDLRERFGVAS